MSCAVKVLIFDEAGSWRSSHQSTTIIARSTRCGIHRTFGSCGSKRISGSLHAAQALIFDRTGKIAKTHSGVRSEFARLAKDDPCIDRAFPTFLAQAYRLKSVADYAVASDAVVTVAEAEQAIETAGYFIDCISGLIVSA